MNPTFSIEKKAVNIGGREVWLRVRGTGMPLLMLEWWGG
jgi:hypothetical protein